MEIPIFLPSLTVLTSEEQTKKIPVLFLAQADDSPRHDLGRVPPGKTTPDGSHFHFCFP